MPNELKPCPFCGSAGKLQRKYRCKGKRKTTEYRIICSNLECEIFPATFLKSTYHEAAEAWNRRADNG